MKRPWIVLTAILLLALSGYGAVHGIRAAIAQAIYHQAKYGSAGDNPRGIFRRCETAHRFYPYNYHFCIWAAEEAFYSNFDLGEDEAAARLETARFWCDMGLGLNFRHGELRLLKTWLLSMHSVAGAITYWEKYVDWEFWEPHNHAVLVELYAAGGEFGKAMESLKWVKGSEYYAEVSSKLSEAWRKETMLDTR